MKNKFLVLLTVKMFSTETTDESSVVDIILDIVEVSLKYYENVRNPIYIN